MANILLELALYGGFVAVLGYVVISFIKKQTCPRCGQRGTIRSSIGFIAGVWCEECADLKRRARQELLRREREQTEKQRERSEKNKLEIMIKELEGKI